MEKLLVIVPLLMAFVAQTAYSEESYTYKNHTFLLINSGAIDWERYENLSWAPDTGYINKGKPELIDPKIDNIPGYMKSLRYFPQDRKNCYKVYLDWRYKFIFRAGFLYGNYDGQSKPPTFDLLIDGHFWATVNTSASDQEPIFHEIIYKPKGESTLVCLVRTRDYEVPFISSLVMVFLPQADGAKPVYKLMDNDKALHLVSRTTFGSLDEINPWTWYNCDEYSFRTWQPKFLPGYHNFSISVNTDRLPGGCLAFSYENRPPDSLLNHAITPPNATDSISLQVDFGNSEKQSAYFVFYFQDFNLTISQNPNITHDPNSTRKFEIYIDGSLKNVVELNGTEFGQVVSLFPVEVSGTAKVAISPSSGSVLPPILNGMEVYTASEISWGGSKLCCSGFSLLFSTIISLLTLIA